jgi:hypothetical protein
MRHIGLLTKIAIGLCCFVPAAFADLIESTPFEIQQTGTGFGNVSTLITLQTANGMSTTEAGCIGFSGSTTDCGITQVGKIKNTSSTQPVPSGATAADLRFIFNADQPKGGSITLDQLEVSFYGTSSTPLFTASLASSLTPLTLTSTFPGVGKSGFVFQLSPSEVTSVNAILSSTTEIGAGFSASGASGGPDTLFLETVPSTHPTIPEPASSALVGAGLLIVGFFGKRFAAKRVS